MKNQPARKLVLVLAVQLMLSACTATAHSPTPGDWPQPKPTVWPDPVPLSMPVVRSVPNFQAPSATHCARPVQTREVPGRSGSLLLQGNAFLAARH